MSKLQYLGHSCFLLTADNGWKGIFDPYENGSVPGLKLPDDLSADQVFVSHGHGDHNAIDRGHIKHSGNPCPYRISVRKTDHDEQGGALRGSNDITILESDSEKIVHCGDLGRKLSEPELDAIRNADILMIPCGGYYTIDAATAAEILAAAAPRTAVLMHYRSRFSGFDVLSTIETIETMIPNTSVLATDTIDVTDSQGIVALEPAPAVRI